MLDTPKVSRKYYQFINHAIQFHLGDHQDLSLIKYNTTTSNFKIHGYLKAAL